MISSARINREEGRTSFARIKRKTPMLIPELQCSQSFLYGIIAAGTKGEEDQMVRTSA